MAKYDKMVEHNRRVGALKEEKAIKAIYRCLEDHEPINALRLAQNTGLSRAYFYTNKRVHEVYIQGRKEQDLSVWIHPAKPVLDTAMDKHIHILEKQISALEKEVQRLTAENVKLKKNLEKNDLSKIKSLF